MFGMYNVCVCMPYGYIIFLDQSTSKAIETVNDKHFAGTCIYNCVKV